VNGYITLETVDPAQFELALRPWELLARPKTADVFRHRVTMLRGPQFIIYREAFSSSMSVLGLGPRGMLAIGVPLSLGNGAAYWGQVHSKSSCALSLSGPLEVTWDHAHEQIVALLNLDSLQKSLTEHEFEHFYRLAQAHRVDLPPVIREALAFTLNKTLKVCGAQPALATSPAFLSKTYVKLVSLLSLIARASSAEEKLASRYVRSRAINRVTEYIGDNTRVNPSMAELCEVAKASERTLQYAFQDAFNLSPSEFLMRRRLHSVRRALMKHDPNSASVGVIAMDHGFYELGRFAVRYKAYFGEKPSKTLALRNLTC
jgi:AraC-like DNA-binding protein